MSLAEEMAEKYKLGTDYPEGDGWSWEFRVDPKVVAALNELQERCAKEADYFAKHSITAKNIAARIRSL